MNSSKNAKPRLVVLLSRFPYPLEKGDKLRAFHQITGLSEQFDIYLICLTEFEIKSNDLEVINQYCKEVHLFKLNRLLQIFSLFNCFFTEKPFQVAYFWQYHIHRKIGKIIERVHPEYIFSQLIRTTEYIKDYHQCPKVLDYMDVLSKGIERRIEIQPWYLKYLFKQEFIRLRNYERYIFDYFEQHIIISEQDQSYIIHPKSKEIAILKNGISEKFFISSKYNTPTYDLVFTGNMSYIPNIEASKYIVKEIIPLLKKDIKLLISGIKPSKSVLKLKTNQVEISGWVEDIRESYLQAKVFVAPMFLGTGLQNKLLEAMALGIPCVTTTMANTALGAIPEESILIANSKDEFKFQIERLLKDDELYSKIKNQGKAFVKDHFSWISLNEQLTELIVNSTNKMMN